MLHGNGYYGYNATAKRFDKVEPPPEYIEDGEWELVTDNPSAAKVRRGAAMLSYRGHRMVLTGGGPPPYPSSTGRVYTEGGLTFFPSVFNLRWQKKGVA